MDLPQVKSENGKALLRSEYKRFKEAAVEKLTGVSITAQSLKEAIRTVNAKRAAIHRLSSLRKADPAPISGLDALLANQVFFYDNPARFTESVNKICDELESESKTKRVSFRKTPPAFSCPGSPGGAQLETAHDC
jgi:benzoyl-CoA reductase/2-hydroxyglutaryl-CoA dehydratase subunit BcrC/BadD/HgdB